MDQKELRFTRGEVEALLSAISIYRQREQDLAPDMRDDPTLLDSAKRKLEVERSLLA